MRRPAGRRGDQDGSPGGGRWCDVFEVADGKVRRLFVYLDPDYAGAAPSDTRGCDTRGLDDDGTPETPLGDYAKR